MNWLSFTFSKNYIMLTKIKIDYALVTKSGNTILELRKTIIPKSKLIKNDENESYSVNWEKEIKQIYPELLNEECEKLLKEYQKKTWNNLQEGYLEGGDYIVKCTYDISWDYRALKYKEFKRWTKGEK